MVTFESWLSLWAARLRVGRGGLKRTTSESPSSLYQAIWYDSFFFFFNFDMFYLKTWTGSFEKSVSCMVRRVDIQEKEMRQRCMQITWNVNLEVNKRKFAEDIFIFNFLALILYFLSSGLLRYNWYSALYKFKVCRVIILLISWNDYHIKFSEHPSPLIDTK